MPPERGRSTDKRSSSPYLGRHRCVPEGIEPANLKMFQGEHPFVDHGRGAFRCDKAPGDPLDLLRKPRVKPRLCRFEPPNRYYI